jgi:hypothetical protein
VVGIGRKLVKNIPLYICGGDGKETGLGYLNNYVIKQIQSFVSVSMWTSGTNIALELQPCLISIS